MRLIRFLVNATKYTDAMSPGCWPWKMLCPAIRWLVRPSMMLSSPLAAITLPRRNGQKAPPIPIRQGHRRRRSTQLRLRSTNTDRGNSATADFTPFISHCLAFINAFLLLSDLGLAWLAQLALVSPSRLSSLYVCLARRDTSTRPTLQPTLSCQASSER